MTERNESRNTKRFQRAIAFVIVVFFSGACAGTSEANSNQDEPTVDREFTFSSDPSVEILTITFRGGLRRDHPSYKIYGDGRYDGFCPGSGTNFKNDIRDLTFENMRGILRIAVDHQLAESSREDIEKKILAQYPRDVLPQVADGHDMIFSIRLTSFSRDGIDLGPRENTIVLHSPGFLLRIAPDVEELKGLDELQRRLIGLCAK